jgi:fatty acid desaturase
VLGSVADMAYFYLAPVMVFGWWLVCVTYLQHHSENTIVYGNENWKFDLAVRCAFFGRNLHSRMPLVPTPARLKRWCV